MSKTFNCNHAGVSNPNCTDAENCTCLCHQPARSSVEKLGTITDPHGFKYVDCSRTTFDGVVGDILGWSLAGTLMRSRDGKEWAESGLRFAY